MQKSERIVRYTAEELDEKLDRGEDQTDWDYVDSLTEEELEASIDIEEEGLPIWETALPDLLLPKKQLTIRLDGDIVKWFKDQGPGYQTRMNAILRSYMNAQKQIGHRRE